MLVFKCRKDKIFQTWSVYKMKFFAISLTLEWWPSFSLFPGFIIDTVFVINSRTVVWSFISPCAVSSTMLGNCIWLQKTGNEEMTDRQTGIAGAEFRWDGLSDGHERVAGLGHTTEQVCGFLFAESQGCWVKGTVLANASRRVGGVSVGKQCSDLHVCGGRKLWWTLPAYTINISRWARRESFTFPSEPRGGGVCHFSERLRFMCSGIWHAHANSTTMHSPRSLSTQGIPNPYRHDTSVPTQYSYITILDCSS